MRRSPKLASVTLVLALVLGLSASASAQVTPGNVTFLDVPIAGGWSITPTSINDHGVVTANIGYDGPASAMLWDKNNGWRSIGGLGLWTYPEAINNNGMVVGMNLRTDFSRNDGVLFDPVNGWREMQMSNFGVFPRDINDSGVVTGYSDGGWFTYSEGAGAQFFTGIEAVAINNSGVVAGMLPTGSFPSKIARREPTGVVTPLSPDNWGYAEDINNAGQIAGMLHYGGLYRAAVWAADGTLTTVLPLGGSDYEDFEGPQHNEFARATAINDHGQMVGITTTATSGMGWVPFVWDPVSGMREIVISGYSLLWPVAINNNGEVIARILGGHDRGLYFTVPLPVPPTPQAATEAIADEIQDLVTSGALSASNASSITTKLDAAIAALDRGNVTAAGNQLNAAINRVNALVNSGKLTAAQGQEIRAALQGVINSL